MDCLLIMAPQSRAATRFHMQGEEASIPGKSLCQLIGSGAFDRQGKGNINGGEGGIAFVVASAESIPGSPEIVVPGLKAEHSIHCLKSILQNVIETTKSARDILPHI